MKTNFNIKLRLIIKYRLNHKDLNNSSQIFYLMILFTFLHTSTCFGIIIVASKNTIKLLLFNVINHY